MSSSEDYLDSLLRAAMEPPKPPSLITESMEDSKNVELEDRSLSADETSAMFDLPENDITEASFAPEEQTADFSDDIDNIQENSTIAEEIAQDMAQDIADVSFGFEENQKMSQEDIEAMLAGMSDNVEEVEIETEAEEIETAIEESAEADTEEIPVMEMPSFDENQKMSQEDIEAMLAGMSDSAEETEAEAEEAVEAVEAEIETETEEIEIAVEEATEIETAIEESAETEAEEIPAMETPSFDENQKMSQEDIEAMLANLNESEESGADEEQPTEQEMEIDLEGVEDIDALLGIKEMPENYKDEIRQDENDDSKAPDEEEPDLEDQDLSDILDLLGGDDSELAEINDILKKSDNNEIVDGESIDEMMADVSGDGSSADEENNESSDGEDDSKASKKKKKLFGRKSKKSKEEAVSEAVEGESQTENQEETPEKEEKKKGLFAKLFDTLTEEAEEEVETEGEEKPKKEKKGKKGKKKGKDAAESNEEILDEMEQEDEAAAKKKKKKEKKPKKQKEPKIKKVTEPELEEPVKKLPKKMIIRIFVLCFSILGVILIFNAFVPKMLYLQRARSLFYKGNYEASYKELIAQEKLSESDTILLKKAELLMHIKRKKDMYDAYEKAGKKEEALNSLLEAAAYYTEMQDQFAVYGISYEAEQTYILIHSMLTDVYKLSDEEINEILQLDKVSYTYKLKELVNGETSDVSPIQEDKATESESEDAVSAPETPKPEELKDPLEAEFD